MRFASEEESKQYFVQYLKLKGYTNIHPTTQRYAYYDIEAEYNGMRYRFELKQRDFDSTKYGDSMMEVYKYNRFKEDHDKGLFDKGVLISLFNDCMTSSDVFNQKEDLYRVCPNSKDMIHYYKKSKHCVTYKQEKKYEYV